jgi:3-methyl-2-oxobutanoate hydroxymethyltransferase
MSKAKKLTVSSFRKMKENGEKIVMLTVYDAPGAALAEACGVEMLLVGDSMAMTVLGYRNTLPFTLEESLHHCKAVRRGSPDGFVIGDMPFMSYQAGNDDAIRNAGRYLKEAGCDAIKLEGGTEVLPLVERFTSAGIPVVGHIGLLPQRILTAGGYKVTGKTEEDAERLIKDAIALENAGAFCIVLECMPSETAKRITEVVSVPTIGIGAGVECDGQVQVMNDILGLFSEFVPKHAKRYANLTEEIRKAFKAYCDDVKKGDFPGPENTF